MGHRDGERAGVLERLETRDIVCAEGYLFELGVRYLGVCCGAGPHHVRAMAEALGRSPAASRYSADMSRHAYFGDNPSLNRAYQEYAGEL